MNTFQASQLATPTILMRSAWSLTFFEGAHLNVTMRSSMMESANLTSHFERFLRPIRSLFAGMLAVTVLGATCLSAADIEPRAYSNIPFGINFLIVGYAYTEGNATFDPSVPMRMPN